MRKIVIANRKGGVGKSTTAVHLAAGLAAARYKTLLVDTDGQGNCPKMLGVEPEAGLAELLMEEVSTKNAVVTARKNLDLICGSKRLALAARLIAREQYDSQYFLAKKLSSYEGQYDFVVVDTPPAYSEMAINVFFYGEEILVPISMEVLAAYGFRELLDELKPISERSGIRIKYMLPTMADYRKGLTRDIIASLQESYDGWVCDPIHYLARMSELPRKGVTIYEEDSRSRPAVDYARLVKRVLTDE